jgi:hypothetical protein
MPWQLQFWEACCLVRAVVFQFGGTAFQARTVAGDGWGLQHAQDRLC